jgi:hypothetical protein
MTRNRLHTRSGPKAVWNPRAFGAASSHRIRRAALCAIACLFFLIGSVNAMPGNDGNVEYPVKLAFLYNFTKFVEWPVQSYRHPGAPLMICVVGDDPFSPDLERQLDTKTVEGHEVEIRKLKPTENLNVCHIVFIPATAKEQEARIVKELAGSSTLTVGETNGFDALGGIIDFIVEGNKIHIEVNLLAADRAGLKISSKLLSIAKISDGKEQARAGKN